MEIQNLENAPNKAFPKCEVCKAPLKTLEQIYSHQKDKIHLAILSNDGKSFKCQLCHYYCKTKSVIDLHCSEKNHKKKLSLNAARGITGDGCVVQNLPVCTGHCQIVSLNSKVPSQLLENVGHNQKLQKKKKITRPDKETSVDLQNTAMNEDATVFCDICKIKMHKNNMTNHLRGKAHNQKIPRMKSTTTNINMRHENAYTDGILSVSNASGNDTEQNLSFDHNSTLISGLSLIDYEVQNFLGRGAFGQVYKCYDKKNERYFARKQVLLYSSDSINKEAKSIKKEINIYQGLGHHSRIVQYLDTKQDKDGIYIYMEYMEGGSIKDMLCKAGPLSEGDIARFLKHILEGLAYLVTKKIIHRDIKCANILLDKENNSKLCDFGISKFLSKISAYVAETDCGSANWMAPEIINNEKYSYPVDVWSLGATVIEMLTGHPPYHSLVQLAVILKIGNTRKVEFKAPRNTTEHLKTLIQRMTESHPYQRPTVQELLKFPFICPI